jgi:transglutaminase-like putative cysteine protease
MDKSVRRQLKLAVSIVVFLSYAALTTTFDYGQSTFIIPLLMIGFMPIGEWLDLRTPLYKTVSTGVAMFAVLYLTVVFTSRGLLDAVTGLFIFIQGYSMIHVKGEKNYHHILLMSFFILLAAIVLSPSATLGLVLILFLISSAWSLFLLEIALASSRATRYRVDVSVQLKSSHKKIKEGRLVDFKVAMWVSAFTVMLILGTGFIFVLVPRTEAGFLGASQQWQTFTTGESEEVDLSVGGTLSDDTSAVMEVTFTHNESGQFNEELYWRVSTLDSYDGTKWKRNGLITRGDASDPEFRLFHSLGAKRLTKIGMERMPFHQGELVTYELFIDKIPEGGVPALSLMRSMIPEKAKQRVDLAWDLSGDFSATLKSKTDSGVRLLGTSEYYVPDSDVLENAPTEYLDVMVPSDYRLLTSHNLTDETLELVERITDDADSVSEKMDRLNNFFIGNGYIYTREVPNLGTRNPIDEFILNVKQGHCQLYASALALMARSEGIPTRVVKGFRGGSWNDGDENYTVSNDMAHLWVEVFYPGVGWVIYDPSPANADMSIFSISGFTRFASRMALKAKIVWLRDIIGYTQENRLGLMKDTVFRAFNSFQDDSPEGAPTTEQSFFQTYKDVLQLAVFLAWSGSLIFFAVRFWKRWKRLNIYHMTMDQERAQRFYRKLLAKLERLGIICKGKSAEEIVNGIQQLEGTVHGNIEILIDQYQKARFGQSALSAHEYRTLKKQVGEIYLVHSS